MSNCCKIIRIAGMQLQIAGGGKRVCTVHESLLRHHAGIRVAMIGRGGGVTFRKQNTASFHARIHDHPLDIHNTRTRTHAIGLKQNVRASRKRVWHTTNKSRELGIDPPKTSNHL